MSGTAAAGGTFFRFTVGRRGASARHVAYITREQAVLDREAGVLAQNLPEPVREAPSYEVMRENLIASRRCARPLRSRSTARAASRAPTTAR